MKTIAVDQLICGMYIVGVESQQSSPPVKLSGLVKQPQQIALLKQRGVLTVRIDPARQQPVLATETVGKTADSPFNMAANVKPAQRKDRIKTVSLSQEIKQAKNLYQEARQLQKRAFNDIARGNPINV